MWQFNSRKEVVKRIAMLMLTVVAQALEDWETEGSRFKPMGGQTNRRCIIGRGARKPSEHCPDYLEQGTEPPQMHTSGPAMSWWLCHPERNKADKEKMYHNTHKKGHTSIYCVFILYIFTDWFFSSNFPILSWNFIVLIQEVTETFCFSQYLSDLINPLVSKSPGL